MKTSLMLYENNTFTANDSSKPLNDEKASLILGFGEKNILASQDIYNTLRNKFPKADILLCSTSGEIYNNKVLDNSVSITAIEFEKTNIRSVAVNIDNFSNSFDAGKTLVEQLDTKDLCYVLIISDGARVNGSELVRGVESIISKQIPVTGGLAGDASRFQSTLVGLNDNPSSGIIAAVGFYGKDLIIGHGSMGGWDMFGPERIVTKSISNKLFEIDNKNALELYKLYLGNYAEQLPGSALLFPLSVKLPDSENPVVRTILSIDHENGCMVFAGDVPEGSSVRFMKANFDHLIDAASQASTHAFSSHISTNPKLALLISCVGRKLILDKRVEEEVEAVQETFGTDTLLTGFYSYGEISPFSPNSKCELHNQTMTITTFDEN